MYPQFKNKRVVILGLARQGLALVRFFAGAGAHVVVSDMASAEKLADELAALAHLPQPHSLIETVLGGHPDSLLHGCDLLCLSGGVPPQIPLVQQAVDRGIPLSNDSLLTLQLARQRGLGPLIAITGSSGKTTTTALVGEILAEAGTPVHVGGNIGTPLIDRLDSIRPGEPIVLELSSFQLELFDEAVTRSSLAGVGPDVAAILNITPNHLDRHPSMAAYADAKFNLLRHLPPTATVVLSGDDAVTGQLAGVTGVETPPDDWQVETLIQETHAAVPNVTEHCVTFSRQRPLDTGAWLADDTLRYNGQPVCQRDELRLLGDHNVSNMLAAAAISGAAGADVAAMGAVARRFTGVPHRLETVFEESGVRWINDSIATSPERALAGLRSFATGEQTLILLAGGKDKNLPWEALADEVVQRVHFLIGFGAAGPMFVELVQERARFHQSQAPNCAVVAGLPQAVELATQMSAMQLQLSNGDEPRTIVLLSPGGTSYDAYRDFEERGEHFRQLIQEYRKRQQPALG